MGKLIAIMSVLLPWHFPVYAEEVKIYYWADQIDSKLIQEFKEKTGIDVIYQVYDSEETAYAKLSSGRARYDVIIGSYSPFFATYAREKLLKPIDLSRILNYRNVNNDVLDVFNKDIQDKNNDLLNYGILFAVGQTGILYNKNIGFKINSWKWLFQPNKIKKLYKTGISFLDSPEEVYPIVYIWLNATRATRATRGLHLEKGYSKNKKYYQSTKEIYDTMRSISPYIRYFSGQKYIHDLANNAISIAIGYKSDLRLIKSQHTKASDNIQFARPAEGNLRWYEMIGIPQNARNINNAYKFINFLYKKRSKKAYKRLFMSDVAVSISNAQAQDIIKNTKFVRYYKTSFSAQNDWYKIRVKV